MKSALRIIACLFCLLSPLWFVQSELCDGDTVTVENVNLLVVGKDDVSDLADVVILLNIDLSNESVMFLQIPRDTYVNVGTGDYKKINGLSKQLGGDVAMCKAVAETMGVHVDGYVSFDTSLVKTMVDALGGIEVCVPLDMDYDDPYQDISIHLKKGRQLLNGDEAVGFIRYRSGYLRADIARIDAQKIFVSAFAQKLLDKVTLKDGIQLLNLAAKYVRTDVKLCELLELGVSLRKIATENISFATMPGEEVRSKQSNAWFYILSKSGCDKLLKNIGAVKDFDEEHVYSDKMRDEFEQIYERKIEANIYNAGQINDQGVEIIPK